LLRNGHSRVYEYGYSLFIASLEEVQDHQRDQIVDMATAHRISKVDNDTWKKFISDHEKSKPDYVKQPKKKPKKMTIEDHKRVIARLRGIG